jgi:hypothetical protein
MEPVFKWHYKYASIGAQNEFKSEFYAMVKKLIDLKSINSSKIFYYREDVIKDHCPVFYKHLESIYLDTLLCGAGIIIVYPGQKFPIHVDHDYQLNQQVGLNFPVLNCENSYTVWYENVTKKSNLNKNVSGNSYTDQIQEYDGDDPVEVARCESIRPIWINSGLPHAAESHNPNMRITMSVRFHKEILEMLKNEDFVSR